MDVSSLKELAALFAPAELRLVKLLCLLTCVGAGLEALTVGLVFLLFNVLQDPSSITSFVNRLVTWSSMPRPAEGVLVTATCLVVLIASVSSSIYSLLLAKYVCRFISRKICQCSGSLLTAALSQPFSAHLATNSAQTIREVTDDVRSCFTIYFLCFLSLLGELFVGLALFGILMVIRPVVGLSAFFLVGGFSAIVLGRIKRTLTQVGQDALAANQQMIQRVNQGLNGYKEIRILQCEDFIGKQFESSSRRWGHALGSEMWLRNLPRAIVEPAVVGTTMLAVIVGVTVISLDIRSILPTLALFGLVSIRLVPVAARTTTYLSRMRFSSPAVSRIYAALQRIPPPAPRGPSTGKSRKFRSSIALQDVTFAYSARQAPVLKDVSLTILKGERIGIMGESGSGKTTLANLILGLLEPTAGKIEIDGSRMPAWSWQANLGYISQDVFLIDDTIRRNIAFGVPDEEIDDQAVWQALETVHLLPFVSAQANGLDTPVGERGTRISGGERQRIGIARALYWNPQVLVFDEMTAALDAETAAGINAAISCLPSDKTMIVVTHRLADIAYCGRAFRLKRGQLEESRVEAIAPY